MCVGYERDIELGDEGDSPCCKNCCYNNDTADNCLLGDDYPMDENELYNDN